VIGSSYDQSVGTPLIPPYFTNFIVEDATRNLARALS